MRKALTLSVPEDFLKALSSLSRRDGMSRSQKALQLMKKQLAIEELRHLSQRMSKKASTMGFKSDEDVFEYLA